MAMIFYESSTFNSPLYNGKTISEVRRLIGGYTDWYAMVMNTERYIPIVKPDMVHENYVVRPDDLVIFQRV